MLSPHLDVTDFYPQSLFYKQSESGVISIFTWSRSISVILNIKPGNLKVVYTSYFPIFIFLIYVYLWDIIIDFGNIVRIIHIELF